MNDGWIEWKGGECPVGPDTEVQVAFRSSPKDIRERSLRQNPPAKARELRWNHSFSASDIIAYRVVKP